MVEACLCLCFTESWELDGTPMFTHPQTLKGLMMMNYNEHTSLLPFNITDAHKTQGSNLHLHLLCVIFCISTVHCTKNCKRLPAFISKQFKHSLHHWKMFCKIYDQLEIHQRFYRVDFFMYFLTPHVNSYPFTRMALAYLSDQERQQLHLIVPLISSICNCPLMFQSLFTGCNSHLLNTKGNNIRISLMLQHNTLFYAGFIFLIFLLQTDLKLISVVLSSVVF